MEGVNVVHLIVVQGKALEVKDSAALRMTVQVVEANADLHMNVRVEAENVGLHMIALDLK